MIEYCTGDMLQANVESYVNPVNCVGVMGKGLAKQFKHRYPLMYCGYQQACQSKLLQLGRVWTWVEATSSKTVYIICFPTKDHWKDSSLYCCIKDGLDDLVKVVKSHLIKSIAIPALGCGEGGLKWNLVKTMIENCAGLLPDVRMLVYEPLETV